MYSKIDLSLAAVALMLPLSAFAASKNSSNVEIPEEVVVNGKQIQPGSYKVEWNGTGPNVEVSILQGHKTIAEAPARLVDKSYEQQAIVTHQNKSGDNVLDQIQLKNKELDLNARSGGNSGANPAANSGS
jgi:hypothetical protein